MKRSLLALSLLFRLGSSGSSGVRADETRIYVANQDPNGAVSFLQRSALRPWRCAPETAL